MTGHPEWECDGSDEAALNGIYDALQRLRDSGDQYASSQCDEVIAICCGRLASIYGTKSVDVIRWLHNPQHDLAPKSFKAFAKEKSLSEAFKLHYSKKALPCVEDGDPNDTIIVNIPRSRICLEDPEISEVVGSQELSVCESTCRNITGQGVVGLEDILPEVFDTLDKTNIPEHDINSKSSINGTTLLPTSDSDVQQPSIPNPRVLAQEACDSDHGSKLLDSAQGTEDSGPARLDTRQEPNTGGLAETLQSYERFLAVVPTLYKLSYETYEISRQLPLLRGSETGCLEHRGYSTDHSHRPMRTLLPDHTVDDQRLSDTRKLEEWALVSRVVTKRPYRQSSPPLIELPPLKNNQNKSQMLGQLSLPVLWHRRSTSASTTAIGKHYSIRPATAGISTVKNQRSGAKSSKVSSPLNALAEQGWQQLLPEELVTELALMNNQCTKSWMASFGRHVASYRSGELYHCPFGDRSRLLKSYDADDQLILVSRPKAEC